MLHADRPIQIVATGGETREAGVQVSVKFENKSWFASTVMVVEATNQTAKSLWRMYRGGSYGFDFRMVDANGKPAVETSNLKLQRAGATWFTRNSRQEIRPSSSTHWDVDLSDLFELEPGVKYTLTGSLRLHHTMPMGDDRIDNNADNSFWVALPRLEIGVTTEPSAQPPPKKSPAITTQVAPTSRPPMVASINAPKPPIHEPRRDFTALGVLAIALLAVIVWQIKRRRSAASSSEVKLNKNDPQK